MLEASCMKLKENGRFGNKNVEILFGGDCGKGTKRFCEIWLSHMMNTES